MGRMAEWVRRAVDLEHWAAFRMSFDRLAALFERVGRGEGGGKAPSTICVLSGDVHHTYVSEADYKVPLASRVYQITCSPIHNTIPLVMRLVFRIGWSKVVERVVHQMDRVTRVPPLPIKWHHPAGPYFGNMLALLTLDGSSARVRLERAVRRDASEGAAGKIDLTVVKDLSLTETRATP
jgi:hypothetical protein